MGKKCIFHIPVLIDSEDASGSSVRPKKMIDAFLMNGYDVDIVSGYSEERKRKITDIKNKIQSGVKYDFLYAESSTMPTMLTEKNHIPKNINLDFSFFRFCKNKNIPIGLFYRDIHWKFPLYKETVHGLKRHLAVCFYKYDLRKYKKYLDCMFLPTMNMCKYIEKKYLPKVILDLPPGTTKKDVTNSFNGNNQELRLLYVGGIGAIYQFDELLKGIRSLDNVKLTICCREAEWTLNCNVYQPYLTKNVKIVHKAGSELVSLYDQCDVCMAFFNPKEYMKMAMPVKIFEYLSYCKPIIATQDTAAGDFVQKSNIGWSIRYGSSEIKKLILHILGNRNELEIIKKNMELTLKENTWTSRAEKVAKVLMSKGNK